MEDRFRRACLYDHLSEEALGAIAQFLKTPPLATTLRINTIMTCRREALETARNIFVKVLY